jgi:uncharacterized protein YdeI (YjbR/CyaY-like superfamily)
MLGRLSGNYVKGKYRNREHVARLIRQKKMRSTGLKHIEAAKKDGRWDGAYDSPANMKIPDDFLAALRKDKKAHAFSRRSTAPICIR